MGLTRKFITEVTDCPKCGQLRGIPCRSNGKNHFERMHKAQIENPEEAGHYKPKKAFSVPSDLVAGSKVIRAVPCSTCSSGPGNPCRSSGQDLRGYHLDRVSSVSDSLTDKALSFYSYNKLKRDN